MSDGRPIKQRWRIRPASCICGGRWAWVKERPSGAWEMQGCVCHHPWTLALRAGTDKWRCPGCGDVMDRKFATSHTKLCAAFPEAFAADTIERWEKR